MAVLLVVIGIVLVVACFSSFAKRKVGEGLGFLLVAVFFTFLGVTAFQDSGPYAKEKKLLASYGDWLALLVRNTSPSEVPECRVTSVEVYDRTYSNEKSVFGKVHLHFVDYRGLEMKVAVNVSWNEDKGEWQSVAESELKLLALDRQLVQIERAKRTLQSLGYE